MRHLVRTAILVVVVMAIFTGAIFPPSKNLRLGKDLAGGVSLVYSVALAPGEDSATTIASTISVLKRRVDPDGLYEISMVAQGRDRIEITMPLPNQRVKDLRAEYERSLENLGRLALDDREFTRLMAMDPTARATEIARVSAGSDTLEQSLREAARAADAGRQAAAEFAAAIARSAPPEEINGLAALKAQADQQYDAVRDRVLRSSLTADMVRQALDLSSRGYQLEDEATGEMVPVPSPRDAAIAALREQYPEAAPQLDGAIAAHDAYTDERTTLDDPQDLVRLLRGAGVLTFRITVDAGTHREEARLRQELRENGPGNVASEDARWYKFNQVRWMYDKVHEYEFLRQNPAVFFQNQGFVGEEWGGEYYVLCWDVRGSRLTPQEGEWACRGAYATNDQQGRPAIGFGMDARGAVLLGELTGAHVGDHMAVLLDDEVYTAPVLNAQISSSGIIEGVFTPDEIQYITQVLSAGSLQAKLSREPISQITIGPELGLDNLKAGLRAGYWAFFICAAFMIVYYFLYGVVAFIALLATGIIILGAMALNSAAFSLPGIAGIVLTFGQAVDANVLIYERVREELRAGKDLRTAMRLGYDRAFSSIVDGNMTNLIVCVVLLLPGLATPEIKGFALTLGLGVLATLFSGLVLSRLLFDVLLAAGVRKMSMLPLAFPVIDRMLTFKIDWLRLRWIFAGVAIAYMLASVILVAVRGEKMLDNEFLGGTKVTLQFRTGDDGQPVTLTRAEVADRLNNLVSRAQQEASQDPAGTSLDPAAADRLRRRAQAISQLATAEVQPLNPESDGVTSDRFTIKTLLSDQTILLETLTREFQDVLDVKPAYTFAASDLDDGQAARAPVYPILSPRLGASLEDGEPDLATVGDLVPEYQGGVAIVLRNLQPRPSLEDLTESLDAMRQKSDFSGTLGRQHEVRILTGNDEAVESAVVLVHDEATSFFDSQERWSAQMRDLEWRLVVQALTNPTTLAQVENFSPAVAGTIRAQAIAAVTLSCLLILIYIWVRFGSVRYSLAAIACTLHDVITVLGVLALCQIFHESTATSAIAQSMGILPFKVDLNMVAAILTIIGFSLNGGIIVLDRIREIKGKLPHETADMINTAINVTISRTVITSGTTLFSTIVLYLVGGEGVRAFAFALTIGVFVATYSGMAIVAPIVWSAKRDKGGDPGGLMPKLPAPPLPGTAPGDGGIVGPKPPALPT